MPQYAELLKKKINFEYNPCTKHRRSIFCKFNLLVIFYNSFYKCIFERKINLKGRNTKTTVKTYRIFNKFQQDPVVKIDTFRDDLLGNRGGR